MESHLNTIFPRAQQNLPRFAHPVPSSYVSEPRVLQDTTGNRQEVLDSLVPDFAKTPLEERPAATDTSRTSKRRRGAQSSSTVPPFTEEQSAAYCNYRAKIRRIKASSNAVWPDALEEVFQEALRKIECIGKKKMMHGHKAKGRNELISEYIFKKTGIIRSRKQVSSHLQVLKSFMAGNDSWMKLVTPAKNRSSRLDEFNHFSQNMLMADPNHGMESDRSASNLSMDPGDDFTINNVSGYFAGSSQDKSVRPTGFDMWLQPMNQSSNQAPHGSPHIYTTLSETTPLQPQLLDSIKDWRSAFPDLLNLHPNGAVNSEIVLLDSTINLMKTYPPEGSRLGFQIEVTCENQDLLPYRWRCKTSIYSTGKRVYQKCKEVTHHTKNGLVIMSPAFGSNFWAHQFISLVERLSRAQDNPHLLQQEEIRSHNFIKGLSAVQELIAIPKNPHAGSQRVAIFLWTFSATQYGEPGRTTWRRIVPPPVSILPNSSNSIDRYAPPAPAALDDIWAPNSDMAEGPRYRGHPEVPSNAPAHAPFYSDFAWNFNDAYMDSSSLASTAFDIHYDMTLPSTEFPDFNHLETTAEEAQHHASVQCSEFTPNLVDPFYPQ